MPDRLIGLTIRNWRRQKGLTQNEGARRVGISASYLNLIESNKRAVRMGCTNARSSSGRKQNRENSGNYSRRLQQSIPQELLRHTNHLEQECGTGMLGPGVRAS
jgi:hypothetical protein